MPKKANAVTYEALMNEVEKLKQRAALVRQEEVRTVVNQIHRQMKQYNLSPDDIQVGSIKKSVAQPSSKTVSSKEAASPRRNKPHTRRKASPKFQDPVSGATWSGRGKTPKWISSARGKSKEDFAIAH